MERKTCRICGETKEREGNFYFTKKGHWRGECNACKNKLQKEKYSKRNKEKLKLRRIESTYGLEAHEYKQMLKDQGSKCAICGELFDNSKPSTCCCVDHDHETEAVRGLLCGSCNRALGMFKDNEEILMKAIDYLRRK